MPHHIQRERLDLALRVAAVLLLLLIFLHGHGWAQGVKPTGQGQTHVICDSGCSGSSGGGGTSQADTSAFTQGTTALTPVGGEYTTALSNCVAGGACTWRFTIDRAGYVNISHYNGSAVGAGNPFFVTPGTGALFAVTQSTSPWVDNVTTWAGGTLGAMANYGTSPGAVLVPGVNAFITNTPAVTQSAGPWTANITQWAGGVLGATSNYGTSPGAVAVPGFNAFITNVPAVSQSGNWTARIVGNAGATVDAAGQNVAAPANWLQAGCQFNTAPTTITTGNGSPCQLDSAGNLLVDLKLIAGVAPITSGGALGVYVSLLTTAAAALSLFQNSAVTTAVVVKASAGNLYGFVVPAVSTCFLQFMNTASSPVLGTNAVFSVPVSTAQTWTPEPMALNNFTTGISVGLSTTYNGATACATSGPVVVFYK